MPARLGRRVPNAILYLRNPGGPTPQQPIPSNVTIVLNDALERPNTLRKIRARGPGISRGSLFNRQPPNQPGRQPTILNDAKVRPQLIRDIRSRRPSLSRSTLLTPTYKQPIASAVTVVVNDAMDRPRTLRRMKPNKLPYGRGSFAGLVFSASGGINRIGRKTGLRSEPSIGSEQ